MKNLLIALSLLLSSCAAVKTPYTDSRGDKQAAYAQSLMINAVKFEETVTVLVTDLANGTPSVAGMKSSGSGVVVGVDDDGTSTILTAWHVCDRYPVGLKQEDLFQSYEVIEDEQVVITPDQKRIPVLKVVYSNKEADTCMVRVKHTFAAHAELADEMPPRGAMVHVVGAPLGQWGDFLVSMSDGRFFGYTDIDVVAGIQDTEATHMVGFAYYGFAGVGGYSGSGIYYMGKLIGLHTAGASRYEHASFGPALKELKRAIKEANG